MRRQDRTVLVAAIERPGARAAGRGGALLEQVMRAAGTRRSLRARLVPGYLPPTVGLLRRAVDRALACEPDAVILLAEGPGDEILLERFASNRAPSERGRARPRLISAGPAAYLGPAATGPALQALVRAGIPCRASTAPGTGAANAGYFLALHRLRGLHGDRDPPPALLLRVPERSPGLPLRRSARAVLLLVDHLATRSPARGAARPKADSSGAPRDAPLRDKPGSSPAPRGR